jgi:hypothetical protein
VFQTDASEHPRSVYHFCSRGTSLIRCVACNANDRYEVFKAGLACDSTWHFNIPFQNVLWHVTKENDLSVFMFVSYCNRDGPFITCLCKTGVTGCPDACRFFGRKAVVLRDARKRALHYLCNFWISAKFMCLCDYICHCQNSAGVVCNDQVRVQRNWRWRECGSLKRQKCSLHLGCSSRNLIYVALEYLKILIKYNLLTDTDYCNQFVMTQTSDCQSVFFYSYWSRLKNRLQKLYLHIFWIRVSTEIWP